MINIKIRNILLSTLILSGTLIIGGCSDENSTSNNVSTSSSAIIESTKEEIISQNNNYSNPCYPVSNGIKKETYMADPFVIRDESTGIYYLYCTQTDVFESDSNDFRTFKRGPVFSSMNGVDWKYKANVFENYEPNWGTNGAGVWAPTVCKVGDYYNFYYSLSVGGDANPGIGVARSKTPYGPFEHYGKLFNSNEIGVTNSIDPYVFYDNDKLYMAWGSYGGLITIVELEADGLSLKGGLQNQYDKKVAIAGYELNESKNYEGTIIIKKDGKYYLFLSTGTCCSGVNSTYHVVVATSDNLFGPYTDSKGRNMFGPDRGDYVVTPSKTAGVMGVGHNGFLVDDNGDYWMVYHGYDTKATSHPEWRVTYLDKLLWDKETKLPYIENRRASNHEEKPGPYIKALEENN